MAGQEARRDERVKKEGGVVLQRIKKVNKEHIFFIIPVLWESRRKKGIDSWKKGE